MKVCAPASRAETELFFESVLRENRSVLELLSANYTFLNERLAKHYGIPGDLRLAVPPRHADRSEARRTAGAGQSADRDFVSEPDIGGAARQVDSGESAGHAAARSAAGRSGSRSDHCERST